MSFAEYKFFSWTRKGIARNIAEKDTLGKSDGVQTERAKVPVDITLNTNIPVPSKNFTLIGPGDIIGIQSDMIIRSEPRSGVSNFEPNYFPYVEFYDEDFPWRYSPASAAGANDMCLRPWISLIALKEDEFEDTALQSPLKSIVVKNMEAIQPPGELHLWAHTHSNLKNEESNFEEYVESLAVQVKTDPDGLYSRVLCPRKLEANVMYHAFLIPTFETGRMAALGQSINGIPAQKAAWAAGANEIEFPVYCRWNFRTGANFDFESLVKLIEPRVMDKRVGVRPMDCSKPGYFKLNSPDEIPAPNPVSILLEGAVKAPTAESTTIIPNDFQTSVAELVNLNRRQEENLEEDPIVTIPFYGMYHAMRKDLSKPGEKIIPVFDPTSDVWYNDLNGDPRNRVPAGFGVKAVQDGQEKFMDQAWDQLSDVLEANRKSRLAQVMSAVMGTSFQKNMITLGEEKVLSVTRSLASKIIATSVTVKKVISQSRVPDALFMAPTQKLMRVNSSVSRSISKSATAPVTIATIAKGTNKPAGITSASIDKFKSIEAMTNITTVTPSGNIGKLNIGSVISNLDTRFKLETVRHDNGAFRRILLNTVTPTIRDTTPISGRVSGRFPGRITGRLPGRIAGRIGGSRVSVPIGTRPVAERLPTDIQINAQYKDAYKDYNVRLGYTETIPQKPAVDLQKLSTKTLTTIKPLNAYKSMLGRMVIWDEKVVIPPADDMLPAMAYPDFPAPTYKLLIDRDKELLLPNLELIQPNTFSLLRTNQKFIESYLIGLNYEMGRELLWREYPTDMRGSYFRQFWDVKVIIAPTTSSQDAEALKDIKPIHKWPKENQLGKNNARDENGDSEQLVFVIRGDLLKKFPNTLIYAQKAFKDGNGKWFINRELDDAELAKQVRFPLYQAEIPPDIKLLGFDLTVNEAAGVDIVSDFPGNKEGWFFVIAEVPGEPRFGMDISFDPDKPEAVTWNDLSWENFDGGNIPFISGIIAPKKPDGRDFNVANQEAAGNWGRSAADMASILLQRPVMIAVHATEMLDKEITDKNTGSTSITKLMVEYINYRTNVLRHI